MAAGNENLLEIDWPGARRLLCALLLGLMLSLLGTLALARSAYALGPEAPGTTQGAPGGTEESSTATPAGEEPTQVGSGAQEGAASPEGPPAETGGKAPASEVPAETVTPPQVPVVETSEVVPTPPASDLPAEVATTVPSVVEETAETTPVLPVAQESSKSQEETVTPRAEESSAAAGEALQAAVAPGAGEGGAPPPASSAPSGALASAPAVDRQATTPSGADTGQATLGTRTTRLAGAFACALSSLAGSIGGICSGWPDTPRLLAGPSFALASAAARSSTETAGSPVGDTHAPSAVATPPINPAPSPAPGGASGAAAGGSGFAPVGFLSLAGLLLLGAPRAMRRLRLSFRLRTTACFALIPERPG